MGLISGLQSAVGSRHVRTDDLDSYVVDWTGGFGGPASAVVEPRTSAEVADVVKECRRHGVALVTQGGNTGLVGGSVPDADSSPVVLRLSRMNDVLAESANSGVLIAGAGATLAQVQVAAARIGRYYPVDLAARDQATIGGTVATNAGGMRVCAFGMTRAQVLGLEFVLGTGELVSDLVPLVKDNTGYDLTQLLCGSEGTLGVITKVSVGLVTPPGPSTLLAVPATGLAAALEVVREVEQLQYRLLAAEVVDGSGWRRAGKELGSGVPFDPGPGVALIIELEDGGFGDGLPVILRDSEDVVVAIEAPDRRRLWELREAQAELWSRLGLVHKFDVSLPFAQMDRFGRELDVVGNSIPGVTDIGYFGHLADGNLHLEVVGPELDVSQLSQAVLGLVSESGGSISAEHGVGRAKSAYLSLRRSAVEIETMRRIKTALDPDWILNPGVLLER